MALRQIRTYPDPVLEKNCREVKEMTPRLQELIDDMLETMYDQEGVGLAAPQVGVLRRIVVIDVSGMSDDQEPDEVQAENAPDAQKKKAEPDPARLSPDGRVIEDWQGPLVMINPVILETAGEQKGSEGCLSVPGKAGEVTRPGYVKARALDRDMQEFEVEGVGLLARAICHELDHLDGVVYVTKVEGDLYSVAEEEENQ